MAYTLAESYLYAYPKVGYARNRSRKACFNEGFLKQAILGSKRLTEERVDSGNTNLRARVVEATTICWHLFTNDESIPAIRGALAANWSEPTIREG